jgi:glycosyltransferase involved in cell wall biosynthesis
VRAAPIRILRAITRLNIGGPAHHVVLLNQALNDGVTFESMLVAGTTTPHEGDMLGVARAHGVEPRIVPSLGREISPLDDLVSLARMVQLVRQLKPDVVHTHMAKAGTVGRLAAHVCSVPLIVHTYHGHVFHSYFRPAKTRVFLTIERALGLLTDRVIAVGEGQRREIASYGVVPKRKLVAIPLGLELSNFLAAESQRGRLRQELDIPRDVPLIGIVARLVPVKAHEVFFDAARLVRQHMPDACFVIVGDGERRRELEALVARMGLDGSVLFVGWRSDMPAVYTDLDVVALTSLNEGSPVSLIEALAAARPVVSTAVGGVPEVVVNGQTGLTVPSGDAAGLARAVITLLEDRAAAERFGAAGRRHVYPRYDASRLVDDVRNLYLGELAKRGRPLPSLHQSPGVAG